MMKPIILANFAIKTIFPLVGVPENSSIKVNEKTEVTLDQKDAASRIDELISTLEREAEKQKDRSEDLDDNLSSAGFLKSFGRAVSGKNDKDLAEMINSLGDSLHTMQEIIQIILFIQTQKNVALREFHSVLVSKVTSIETDTKTLDGNQRKATLNVVSALRDQVGDMLRQSELVERHDREIDSLKSLASSIAEESDALAASYATLKRNNENLTDQVFDIEKRLAEQIIKGSQNEQKISSLHVELSESNARNIEHAKEASVLNASVDARLNKIESGFSSLKSMCFYSNICIGVLVVLNVFLGYQWFK